jgi:hypothetical protein
VQCCKVTAPSSESENGIENNESAIPGAKARDLEHNVEEVKQNLGEQTLAKKSHLHAYVTLEYLCAVPHSAHYAKKITLACIRNARVPVCSAAQCPLCQKITLACICNARVPLCSAAQCPL